ncbi:MAG: hypothetical protein ABL897_03385 [Hyphomicrobium sp.]
MARADYTSGNNDFWMWFWVTVAGLLVWLNSLLNRGSRGREMARLDRMTSQTMSEQEIIADMEARLREDIQAADALIERERAKARQRGRRAGGNP